MEQPDNIPDHTTKIMVVVSIFCVILMVCTFFSYFIVVEGQSALRLQLGQVVLDKNNVAEKYKPGVHLMIPFINQVKYFNTKLRTLNYDIANTYTEDKYPINVDYFVTWRINDLGKYYTSTGADNDVTSDIIRQQVGTALQKNIGLSKLEDVVNKRREKLMTDTTVDASKQLQKYGIKLEDFRLNRIELNNSTLSRVYEAMRKKRQKQSQQFLSQGRSEKIRIESGADKRFITTISAAQLAAQKTKAAADETAADNYANAYSKDPAFYKFYKSLQSYVNVFANNHSVMLLKTDSDFLNVFKSAGHNLAKNSDLIHHVKATEESGAPS